ncbi:hypothetical protein [Maribacter aestuarii]|uniref:hypothetical protein n=1 Tax=Maribacter aestuarii TaxID=1130723 RepID=UPI00248CF714|nr:hypothetical protein [Maribacter aestuarii]
MKTWHIYSFVLFCMPLFLMAQNNKKSAEEISDNTESYILTDISYINDAVFMGRRDSIAAPYIFPSIGYYDKSGFFVDASLSYLVGTEENRIDLFLTSLGYTFNGEKLNGGISGTAYFFNEDSYNAKSSVLGDISAFLSYDLNVLEVSAMGSTYFNDGSSTDIFVGLMLDRVFYSNDKSFLIDPSISVYAGSQYFYQEYYSTSRLGNRKGQGQGQGTGGSASNAANTVEIQEASEFNILNVEISLPLQYYHKQFVFSFTPVLAIPQSSATITTEDTVIKEDLESKFYFSAGISYWFIAKKKSQ